MLDSLLLLQPEHLADDHKLPPVAESNSCGSVAYTHDGICQRMLDMPAVLDGVLPGIPHLLRSSSAGTPVCKAVLLRTCYCPEYVNALYNNQEWWLWEQFTLHRNGVPWTECRERKEKTTPSGIQHREA